MSLPDLLRGIKISHVPRLLNGSRENSLFASPTASIAHTGSRKDLTWQFNVACRHFKSLYGGGTTAAAAAARHP